MNDLVERVAGMLTATGATTNHTHRDRAAEMVAVFGWLLDEEPETVLFHYGWIRHYASDAFEKGIA